MHTEVSQALLQQLVQLADPERAKVNAGFAKTGKGEYAQGDKYLGLRVPQLRDIVKIHPKVTLPDILPLLHDEYHEVRLLALLLMVKTYRKASPADKQAIIDAYLSNTRYVNNWDLVDTSCYNLLGPHLWQGDREVLFALCRSDCVWERRISVVTTYYFIKKGDFETTFQLVRLMLNEKQEIVQKAMGWMVKEISKQDSNRAVSFLREYYQAIPRVALRIALEKLPAELRQAFLTGTA